MFTENILNESDLKTSLNKTNNIHENNLLNSLIELSFPLKIKNEEEFAQNLLSPSNIRFTTLDWLFMQLEGDQTIIFDKFCQILSEFDRVEVYLKMYRNLGVEYDKSDSELRKALAGLSSNQDSELVLMNLINFVKIHKLLFGKISSNNTTSELRECILIINYIKENKANILKENIRLFAPEIKLIEKKVVENNNLYNDVNERINNYNKLISKVEKKLEKLSKLDLAYENVEMNNLLELKQYIINFDKTIDGFLKDFNQIYAKDLKYISEDKLSNLHVTIDNFYEKYNVIVNLSNSLEEIFALHNRINNHNLELN